MKNTALLIIDVQEAFNERVTLGHKRNNPDAEVQIAKILAAFRARSLPVFHIRHASTDPKSLFRPSRTGYAPQAFVKAKAGEVEIVKSVNSSFIGTSLEADLKTRDLTHLVICGATTNHCVETTTRMAGNLGFSPQLLRDACWAFDQTGPDGELHSAHSVHQMSLSNLNGEFAEITTVEKCLSQL